MKYFAYGSNMDPKQMARRCPGSVAIGRARLADHRLTFTYDSVSWRGGVGHVEAAPGSSVWGVLWDISEKDEQRLDRYELVHKNVYEKARVLVERDGDEVEALVYLCTSTGYNPPSRRYIAALLRGADTFDLPSEYRAWLASIETARTRFPITTRPPRRPR